MKPRPETDFARRRRLIIGKAPPPVSKSPVSISGNWLSAPTRPDLRAPVSPRLRVSALVIQTSPLIPSHV